MTVSPTARWFEPLGGRRLGAGWFTGYWNPETCAARQRCCHS